MEGSQHDELSRDARQLPSGVILARGTGDLRSVPSHATTPEEAAFRPRAWCSLPSQLPEAHASIRKHALLERETLDVPLIVPVKAQDPKLSGKPIRS